MLFQYIVAIIDISLVCRVNGWEKILGWRNDGLILTTRCILGLIVWSDRSRDRSSFIMQADIVEPA